MAYTANETELLQTLADMVARTGGGSSIFGGMGGGRAEKTDGSGSGAQELIDQSRASDKAIKTLNKSVKQLLKDGINSAELEKMPGEMSKGIEKVNSRYSKKMADSISTLGDVMRTKEQLEARRELIDTLKGFDKDQKLSWEEVEALKEKAEKAGVSFGRLIDPVKKTVTGINALEKETDELTIAFNKAVDSTTTHSRTLEVASTIISKHSAKMKEAFNLYVDEIRIARERGTYDAKYLDAVKGLGINMKEYQTILGDNRDTQQAMAAGGRDFTAELIAGKSTLERYSKDNVQAAQTTATLMRGISGFGVQQKNLSGALKEQTDMYEDNYRVFGITAEAFAKSTEALVADTDIRGNLALMAEKERKQYILGIQAQESQRLAMGYTTDQARELTKMFAALGGESPKERMKKAAKQRALMGALGMGAEGAELQDLMVNINQLTGDARIKAEGRMAELTSQMANALKGKYSQGLGTEMFFRSMADKSGVTDIVNKMETKTLAGKKKDKKAEEKKQKDREVPKLLSDALVIYESFQKAQETSVGLLVGILAAIVGGGLFKMFGKGLFKTLSGGMGKMTGGIAKMGSTLAKTLGVGAAGAASVAAEVGTKGAGSAASAAAKAGGKTAGKVLGKSALKSGIKKIPIIGALAGIGFGISRAMDGDLVGAGLEVASGLASIVPGVGTAASVAIDAGLAVRDMTTDSGRSAGEQGQEPQEDAATVYNSPTQKKIEKDSQLLAVLNELQTYIKSINEQNTQMADAQTNLALTNQEMTRAQNLTANRPG